MNEIIVYGNRSLAKEYCMSLSNHADLKVAGFTIEKNFYESDRLLDLPVHPFESLSATYPPEHYDMIIAVGYLKVNKVRKRIYDQAKNMGYKLINFISPHSIIATGGISGDNCYVGHYTTISYGAKIGRNVFIGNGCSIGHDTIIEDNCFLANDVAISGSVSIGKYSFIGTNATIRNRISIGSECVVGAGATILENTRDKSVYLGEPGTLLTITSDKLNLS